MPNTMTLIASVTVGSGGASTIDFTSIPSTYTDLQLVMSIRSVGTSTQATFVRFNGSSSSQSMRDVEGNGSAASSSTDTNIYGGYVVPSSSTASTFCNNLVYVPNYASSNYKSVSIDSVTENNATSAFASLWAGLWSNTAAINQITLVPNGSNNFAEFSTAYLYGVKNA